MIIITQIIQDFTVLYLGVRKKLFVSTYPIFRAEPKLFWSSSATLEQKYIFRYNEGMFHALTYLF